MANILAILAKTKGMKGASDKGASDSEEEGETTKESSEDPAKEYGDELASMLGVEDKDAFLKALAGYVRNCPGMPEGS